MLFRDDTCFQLLQKFLCSLCVGFVLHRNAIFFFFKRRSSIKMCEAVGATCDCRDANEITHTHNLLKVQHPQMTLGVPFTRFAALL